MKKNAPFKLRSGNKPSPAQFFKGIKNTGLAKNLGSKQFQETGQRKKFSETKVGKTGLGKELSKLTGTIFGGGKFKGEKSIGGQIKNMLTKGNKGKTTNPSTKATVNNTEGVLKGDKGNFAANAGIVKNFASGKKNTPSKPSKPKTTFRQAFDAMVEHPTGGTREDKFGNIYENSPKGFAEFKKAAKDYNKKKRK